MAAAAVLTVLMVMLVLFVVMTAAVMLLMLMMMLMLFVMVAAAVMLVVLMMMLMLFVVMAAAAVLTVLMVMLVLFRFQALLFQLCQLFRDGCLALHGGDQLLTAELVPGSGHQGGHGIVLPDQRDGCVQLGLGNGIRTGQDDGGSGLDLVVVELTEVLHVDLDFACVGNGDGIAKGDVLIGHLLHSSNDVGELAHAGGLDDDAVGIVLRDDLGQGLAEITHQAAADAAGVHLGDVDAGILQEAAVNADLAEFILNEHQFLALVSFLDHLLDEGRLARTEEAGIDIDFCHVVNTFCT